MHFFHIFNRIFQFCVQFFVFSSVPQAIHSLAATERTNPALLPCISSQKIVTTKKRTEPKKHKNFQQQYHKFPRERHTKKCYAMGRPIWTLYMLSFAIASSQNNQFYGVEINFYVLREAFFSKFCLQKLVVFFFQKLFQQFFDGF